ncbi:MAG: hypothetical protein AAFQ50_11970 [Pseudomonadota bacterium]
MAEGPPPPPAAPKALGLGFGAIGFFIGMVAGLSTAELTTTLLALVFALAGGSVIALLNKLDAEGRVAAGQALFAFGLAGSVALIGGALVRVNGYMALTDTPDVQAAARSPLRSGAATTLGECLRLIAEDRIDVRPFCPAQGSTTTQAPGN